MRPCLSIHSSGSSTQRVGGIGSCQDVHWILLRKMIPDALPLLVPEPNHSTSLSDRRSRNFEIGSSLHSKKALNFATGRSRGPRRELSRARCRRSSCLQLHDLCLSGFWILSVNKLSATKNWASPLRLPLKSGTSPDVIPHAAGDIDDELHIPPSVMCLSGPCACWARRAARHTLR